MLARLPDDAAHALARMRINFPGGRAFIPSNPAAHGRCSRLRRGRTSGQMFTTSRIRRPGYRPGSVTDLLKGRAVREKAILAAKPGRQKCQTRQAAGQQSGRVHILNAA